MKYIYASLLVFALSGCSAMPQANTPAAKAVMVLVEELQQHPEYAEQAMKVLQLTVEKDYKGAFHNAKDLASKSGAQCPELYVLLQLVENLALNHL